MTDMPKDNDDFCACAKTVTTTSSPISSSDGFVCGNDCAPPSWDFLSVQLQFAAAAWFLILTGGITVYVLRSTRDLEGLRQNIQVCRGKISAVMVYATVAASLGQCFVFVLRSVTKSVTQFDVFFDIAACLLFTVDSFLLFLLAFLKNFATGTKYLFSRAIVDCLVIGSTLSLPLVQINGKKAWISLSFMSSVHFRQAFRELLDVRQMNLLIPKYQLMYITVSTVTAAFAASMAIMLLENLGDPPLLQTINKTRWNAVSSVYFVVSTISTVGYGDLFPVTSLGRVAVVIGILSGISMLASTFRAVVKVMSLNQQGGGVFVPPIRCQHIIVTGSPLATTVIDIILEVFHPDHAEEAAELRLVFLLPRSTTVIAPVAAWLKRKSNVRILPRITLLSGSVLDPSDLQRCAVGRAAALFLIPNYQTMDALQEDTENIIRMLSVRSFVRLLRIILVLLKAENLKLLHDIGMREGQLLSCIAADKFKMETAGKTCQVPGFSTLICNLCKTMGVDNEDEAQQTLPTWMREYDRGSGNELYEVPLSMAYTSRKALFCEVVMDVIEQSDGVVYLIGLVELYADGRKRVMVNPGARYRIKHTDTGTQILGIFVAPEHEAIVQCEAGGVFQGLRQRPAEAARRIEDAEVSFQNQNAGQLHIDESLLAGEGITKQQRERARELVQLASQHRKATMPARPPLKLLARGDHIVVLCLGVREGIALRLGVGHFVKPLRGIYAKTIKPVVVVAPVAPQDWNDVVNYKKVYFIKGSPLSVFDLERANVRGASVVFVCHAATNNGQVDEAWMADSEVICCTRLVESLLTRDTTTIVITELLFDGNHQFIQLPCLDQANVQEDATSDVDSRLGHEETQSFFSRLPCWRSTDEEEADMIMDQQSASIAAAMKGRAALNARQDYFEHPRYACGQLFVGTVLSSLAVNTYFNPSLAELVSSMIESKIAMVSVQREWVGKTFIEFFDELLWSEDLLAVAIFRQGEIFGIKGGRHSFSDDDERASVDSNFQNRTTTKNSGFDEEEDEDHDEKDGRTVNYVYTAPPGKLTTMIETDRVICFSIAPEALEELRREQDEQDAKALAKQALQDAAGVSSEGCGPKWNSEGTATSG
eukprot:TRINITY_DN74069_c0_g1_i1.p1 TRINITY_DN74069_c0_g1~~TRINITY_DN74069_c0_g1_i1.p1  ORF type:complete len:1107 (+),score=172.79 TRINITY_DN74069_c0_g1_i1:139-3459(+)